MTEWVSKIDRIVCLNLQKRVDRLLQFTEQMEKYEVPFERVNATEDTEQGARGLRDSMAQIFADSIIAGHNHVLVFEDDCDIIVPPVTFHDTMNKVMGQLPSTYHMALLGCQLSSRPSHFHSPNLLPVIKAFSTHSVLYSLQGMKEIMARSFDYPIDNWFVTDIQTMGHTYAIYPLLCSQVEGFSDIGRNVISWKPFIEGRFEQKIAEMGNR